MIGFITDEDLYALYKKIKKSPYHFIQFLKIFAPKDVNIFFKGQIDRRDMDLSKFNDTELKQYLKLTEKAKNTDVITIEPE